MPRVAMSGSLTDRAKCMAYRLEMEPPGTYNCIKKSDAGVNVVVKFREVSNTFLDLF